ncbi:hypothetical protein RNJ44_03390 [Nakaseomyces bracarensis]|uniref:Uncharacterized protein n=1 Tax=Nakaseomyces bracarensis TaxID=273131 RepID=A0ABR4NZL5_9SACH
MITMEDRDPEVEDFLRRVEDLDSKREKPIVKKKSAHLQQAITRDELDGETGLDSQVSDDLRYKSAYNYEKSYGSKASSFDAEGEKSKENGSDNNKTFVISEEDYLLLQKIKNSGDNDHISETELKNRLDKAANSSAIIESSTISKKPPLPSERRKIPTKSPDNTTRSQELVEIDNTKFPARDSKPIGLPPRNSKPTELPLRNSKPVDLPPRNTKPDDLPPRHFKPVELSPKPIQVPDRTSNLPEPPTRVSKPAIIPNRHSKPIYGKIDSASDEDTPPPLPSRNTTGLNKSSDIEDESTPPSLPRRAYKENENNSSKIEKSKPPLPTKPTPLSSRKTEESKQRSGSPLKEIPAAPKKPSHLSNNSSTEHISYLKSMEKNKLTKTNSSPDQKSIEVKPSKEVDFLDSVQLKSPNAALSKSQPTEKPPINIKSQGKDSFISSALKSEDHKPEQSPSKKPIVPRKSDSLLHKTTSFDSLEKKKKPAVPPKKFDGVDINKSKQIAEEKEFQNITLKKRTPPEVASRKPSIPEALLKANALSKGTNVQTNQSKAKENEIPEALKQREALAKGKKAPPIPQRKISMPEALKKAEQLRNRSGDVSDSSDSRSDVSNESTEEPQDINSKLESVLRRAKTSSQLVKEQPMKLPERASTTSDLLSNKHSTLTHPNKNRTRGPKRKPPKKLQ